MAIHSSFWRAKIQRWGLVGGRVERGEDPAHTARREIEEELGLFLNNLQELGDFQYKRSNHKVYTALCRDEVEEFDDTELIEIRWFSLPQIEALHTGGLLHAGYELTAIEKFLTLPAE